MPKDLLADAPRDLLSGEVDTDLDSLISRTEQEKLNPILESALSGSIGGLPAIAAGAKNMEEALPAIGQLIGGQFGGFGGAVGGAGVGSALKEVLQAGLRGKKLDPDDVVGETATTALVEGLTRGAGNFIFRRELANQALNSLARKLGPMKEGLASLGDSNANVSVPKEKVVSYLKDTFTKVKVPFGKASILLKKWQKVLSDDELKTIDPRTLMELEDDLGSISDFATQKVGGVTLATEVRKKALNKAAKELRKIVSDDVDDLAAKSGFKDFGKVSKQISKLKEKFPPSELKKGNILPAFTSHLLSGSSVGAGFATGNPVVGLTAGLMIEGLQNRAARELLFKVFNKGGVGRAVTLGASELGRQVVSD